jgi:hypothetical protein
MKNLPTVFIASSSESLAIAEALQLGLEGTADVTLWTQGIFELTQSFLESLVKALQSTDFAIAVLHADDLSISRGQERSVARDNVLFELGLFMGHLGRQRCFFVYDSTQELKLPSDLLGIAAATFRPHANGNFEAALGPVCAKIKKAIASLGRRAHLLTAPSDDSGEGAGPDLSGTWAGYSLDGPNPSQQNSTMEVVQRGSFVRATVRRDVQDGQRTFEYEGRFVAGQLVLFYEDQQARGYVVGTMVLHLAGNLRRLSGRSTYYHHTEKQVVSTAREYRRL